MFMWSAESVSRGMWAAMKLSRAKMRSWHKQYQSSISNTMAILLENWTIEETTGYKPLTTFYTDFSIAEKFGLDGIKSHLSSCLSYMENKLQVSDRACNGSQLEVLEVV